MEEKSNEHIPLIDRKSTLSDDKNVDQRQSSRLDWIEASWIRWWRVLCFTWIIPILSKGYKQTLTDDDFDDLSYKDKSVLLLENMIAYNWTIMNRWVVIMKAFWKEFAFGGILLIPYLGARMAQPLFLQQIFLIINDRQTSISTGYLYTILLFVCSIIPPFMFQQSIFRVTRTGLRVRNALISLIYTHLLSSNAVALQQINTAQTINLVAIDAAKFCDSSFYLHFLWEGPLEAMVAFGLLCWIIGFIPTLCGYLVLILIIAIQMIYSRKLSHYHQTTATCTDKRLQAFSELINGCHIIKMYNWEEPIKKSIHVMRQNELINIKKSYRLRALNVSLFFAILPLITLVTIVSSWLVDRSLTSIDIFTAISIYGVIRSPVTSFLPIAIEKVIQMNVAMKRIDTFIRMKQFQQQILHSSDTGDQQQKGRITMRDASFSWQDNITCLSSLNIDIDSGSLVSITGPIGSGKSSLFAAILGEMHLVNGQMNVNGSSFSYASQSAWIFADTFRANILLDKSFDTQRYANILRACGLDVDLNIFGSTGDLTMIGEKGVNLSGGQKARLSLARALYIDADIYLLDDPLASVDNRVARQIYNQCIGSHGFLNKKTRILITHQTQYFSESDQIFHLVQGHLQSQDRFTESRIEYETIDRINDETHTETTALTDMLNVEQSTVDTRSIIQDEVSVKGSVSWSVWEHLFIKSSFGWFGLCLLIIVLVIGQILYDGSNIVLSIFLTQSDTNQQHPPILFYIYLSLVLTTLLIVLLRTNYFFYLFLNGTNYLHNNMLNGLINTSMRFYESNPVGRILNRASRDQHVIDEILPATLFDSIQSLLMTVGSIIVVSLANPIVIPMLIPFIIISFILRHVYVRSNHQLKRLESVTRSPVYSLFTSSLNGLLTIRALKVKDYFLKILINRIDANTRAYMNMIVASHWFGLILDLLNNIFSVTAVALTVIFYERMNQSLITLMLMYSVTIKGYFQWGLRQGIEAQILMTSAERIEEYIQLPREEDFGGQLDLVDTPVDWPQRGSIEFRNYSLRYRPDLEPALADINLRIESSEKIGIIGRTGAGKSSLFQGLFRFIDRSCITGEILIDDIDISRITLTHLRSHLSVIPQQPVLFSGTLRYNLDPLGHYTDEQCWMALELVQLKKLISDNTDGLSLLLAESGINFSAGQCQLICAARAILKKGKILLIDEAMANVDRETDSLIQKVLTEKFQDRTVLTIAHRLHTVVQNDRILVLNKGQMENIDVPQNIFLRYQ